MKIQMLTLAAVLALIAADTASARVIRKPGTKHARIAVERADDAGRTNTDRSGDGVNRLSRKERLERIQLRLDRAADDRSSSVIDLDRPARVNLRVASNVRTRVMVVPSRGRPILGAPIMGRDSLVNEFEVLLPAGRSTIIVLHPKRNPLVQRQLAASMLVVDAPQIDSELDLQAVPLVELPFQKGLHPKRKYPKEFMINKGR